MRRNDSSPAAYVADVDGELREMIDSIRSLIREIARDIPEGIRHGMLDYPGLCNLAAQKGYVAVYTKVAVIETRKHLVPKASCGKSCIRFRRKAHLDRAGLGKLLAAVLAAGGPTH